MKGEDLLKAMDGIDEGILAETMKEKKPRRWLLPALAACLALVIGITALAQPGAANIPRLDPANSLNGVALRVEGQEPQETGKAMYVSPQGYFHTSPVVVARAVEVLPDVYQDMPEYGETQLVSWRIFRMEVVDSLDSGLSGSFWFGIPVEYDQDLTAWDTLLLSLQVRGYAYTLRNTADGSLRELDCFFADGSPHHGDIVAFQEGVFDESLWSQGLWADPLYVPWSAYEELDREHNTLIVHRGSTLSEALAEIQARRSQADYVESTVAVPSPQALAAMESLGEGYVGTGMQWGYREEPDHVQFTRYLGGCPTNEYALVNLETGEVIYSEVRFMAEDLEDLPDLSAYMDTLDLDSLELVPDADRGELLYRAVYGWYEKTPQGVKAFVKVTWYHDSTKAIVVYDDLFLQVSLEGVRQRTRQEMTQLLGEGNPNLPWYTQEGPIHKMWK